MKDIVIDRRLQFDYEDLVRTVDLSRPFTLKTLMNAVDRSKIPLQTLCQIMRCNYISDYIREANEDPKSKPSWWGDADGSVIDYLELQLNIGDGHTYWAFRGVGKSKDGFTGFAVELTPLYALAYLEIRISPDVILDTFDRKDLKPEISRVMTKITLMDLIYWILWEFSFFGSVKERDAMTESLKKQVDDIRSGKAKLVPFDPDKFLEKLDKKLPAKKRGKKK